MKNKIIPFLENYDHKAWAKEYLKVMMSDSQGRMELISFLKAPELVQIEFISKIIEPMYKNLLKKDKLSGLIAKYIAVKNVEAIKAQVKKAQETHHVAQKYSA